MKGKLQMYIYISNEMIRLDMKETATQGVKKIK